MPYEIRWEDRGVWVRFKERVLDAHVREADHRIHNDPRVVSIRYVLIDMSAAAYVDIAHTTPAEQAAMDLGTSHYLRSLKNAMIATDPVARAWLNQYADYARRIGIPWEFQLFDDLEQARAWAERVED